MGSGKEVKKCAVCFGKRRVLWLEPRMFVGEVTQVEIKTIRGSVEANLEELNRTC